MCIDVAPAEGYTESNQEPIVKAGKVATASTAVTLSGRKPCKTAHFQAVDPRALFDVAVGNHPLRVDHPQYYRSRESLQVGSNGRCGRCGRYFAALVEDVVLLFSQPPYRSGPQSRFKRCCSRRTDCSQLGAQCGAAELQNGLCPHRAQADQASGTDRGSNLLPTPAFN